MKYEEALKYLKGFVDNTPNIGDYNTRVIKEAINALEYRVPKKAVKTHNGFQYTTYACGNCGDVFDEAYDFCPNCGQAIYWGKGRMKPEDAINWLNEIMPKWDYEANIYGAELKEAIEALEKQVPKKIEYTSYGYPNCPVCEAELDGCNYYSYCPYCGQAINWEKE